MLRGKTLKDDSLCTAEAIQRGHSLYIRSFEIETKIARVYLGICIVV